MPAIANPRGGGVQPPQQGVPPQPGGVQPPVNSPQPPLNVQGVVPPMGANLQTGFKPAGPPSGIGANPNLQSIIRALRQQSPLKPQSPQGQNNGNG